MDASRWIVSFLLFSALQGTDQRPVVDDTDQYFDVFPGGQSTDEVPMHVSTSDEIAATYESAGNFSQPDYTPAILLNIASSLPPPGCSPTAAMSEEIYFSPYTTQTPPNITSHSEKTDDNNDAPVPTYILIGIFFIGTAFLYFVALLVIYLFIWIRDKCCDADLDPEQ